MLAGEFIKEGLRCGDTCIYVACDEPPAAMREHLLSFKVGTPAYEEADRLIFVDAYEEGESMEKYALSDLRNLDKYFALETEILHGCSGRRVRLVVVEYPFHLDGRCRHPGLPPPDKQLRKRDRGIGYLCERVLDKLMHQRHL